MQFSTKIYGFEQKDSQGFENSYNSYEQYPLEKFFIFTIYQNYTLALTKCVDWESIKLCDDWRWLTKYFKTTSEDLSGDKRPWYLCERLWYWVEKSPGDWDMSFRFKFLLEFDI